MRKIAIIFMVLVSLSACFKEEDARVGSISNYATIELGSNYENQIFYSLSDTSIISSNKHDIWDIGLYSDSDESFIRLNAANNFYVIKTGSTNFNGNYDLQSYGDEERRFDGTNIINEKLAIDVKLPTSFSSDTLFTNKEVYLISSGLDALANPIITPKKFVFEGIYQDSYIIRYANIDGSNEVRKVIPRDPTLVLTAFSFEQREIVTVEPDKNTWDLLFTRNTDTVYSLDESFFLTGYAVTGAYLNTALVEAYLETEIAYEEITRSAVSENKFTKHLNAIGHYWKRFENQYSIFPNKVYIVKDRNGLVFKMRFLSFYDDDSGQKGYPSFEMELLQ